MKDELITISKKEYEFLLDKSLLLEAFDQAGVDNWVNYGEAMDLYRELKELDK